jgi:DNA-directed RNA polymerase specialized sigma24 family protein
MLSNKHQSQRSNTPVFNEFDHFLVQCGIDELPFLERLIIELRFWNNFSIEEISKALRISWDDVEMHLQSAFESLKQFCLKEEDFSRNTSTLRAA